jgi:hypothetical protein
MGTFIKILLCVLILNFNTYPKNSSITEPTSPLEKLFDFCMSEERFFSLDVATEHVDLILSVKKELKFDRNLHIRKVTRALDPGINKDAYAIGFVNYIVICEPYFSQLNEKERRVIIGREIMRLQKNHAYENTSMFTDSFFSILITLIITKQCINYIEAKRLNPLKEVSDSIERDRKKFNERFSTILGAFNVVLFGEAKERIAIEKRASSFELSLLNAKKEINNTALVGYAANIMLAASMAFLALWRSRCLEKEADIESAKVLNCVQEAADMWKRRADLDGSSLFGIKHVLVNNRFVKDFLNLFSTHQTSQARYEYLKELVVK